MFFSTGIIISLLFCTLCSVVIFVPICLSELYFLFSVYGLMPHPLLYLIAAGALQFQMCFPPEYFDRFFVYLLFVYLLLFMHQV